MKNSRREFIKAGAIGAAVSATGIPLASLAGEKDATPFQPLEILILGGTGFIGPHMVREALRRGHSVTLFNRGRTNNTLFPDLETIKGDRNNGLDGLKDRQWDAVIDNSGYRVKWATDSAELLRDAADLYLYTSSIGVYYPYLRDSLLEDDALNKEIPPEDTLSEVQKLEYGYSVMKTLSEIEVVQIFG